MSDKTLEELVKEVRRCTSIKELYTKFKYEYLLINQLVEKREQLREKRDQLRRKSSEQLDRELRAIDFQTMADR